MSPESLVKEVMDNGGWNELISKLFPKASGNNPTSCPKEGCVSTQYSVTSMVMHLNDEHKWDREVIAAWVDTQTAEEQAMTVQEALEKTPKNPVHKSAVMEESWGTGYNTGYNTNPLLVALSKLTTPGQPLAGWVVMNVQCWEENSYDGLQFTVKARWWKSNNNTMATHVASKYVVEKGHPQLYEQMAWDLAKGLLSVDQNVVPFKAYPKASAHNSSFAVDFFLTEGISKKKGESLASITAT